MFGKILLKYIEKRKQLVDEALLAPYDWYELNSPLDIKWMPYSLLLQEHSRELANVINELNQHIMTLLAWEEVIEGLDREGDELHFIVIEFISPIATLALNMPYVIRSRFIYSTAHLCHQANQIRQERWVDDFPLEAEIYFGIADDYGKNWSRYYNKLKSALEKIGNKKYGESSLHFRNKYNHRFSPRIELGSTGFVTRMVTDDGISYGVGQTHPLMLKDIIPLLKDQQSQCLTSFRKYQDLVNEQIRMINEN